MSRQESLRQLKYSAGQLGRILQGIESQLARLPDLPAQQTRDPTLQDVYPYDWSKERIELIKSERVKQNWHKYIEANNTIESKLEKALQLVRDRKQWIQEQYIGTANQSIEQSNDSRVKYLGLLHSFVSFIRSNDPQNTVFTQELETSDNVIELETKLKDLWVTLLCCCMFNSGLFMMDKRIHWRNVKRCRELITSLKNSPCAEPVIVKLVDQAVSKYFDSKMPFSFQSEYYYFEYARDVEMLVYLSNWGNIFISKKKTEPRIWACLETMFAEPTDLFRALFFTTQPIDPSDWFLEQQPTEQQNGPPAQPTQPPTIDESPDQPNALSTQQTTDRQIRPTSKRIKRTMVQGQTDNSRKKNKTSK